MHTIKLTSTVRSKFEKNLDPAGMQRRTENLAIMPQVSRYIRLKNKIVWGCSTLSSVEFSPSDLYYSLLIFLIKVRYIIMCLHMFIWEFYQNLFWRCHSLYSLFIKKKNYKSELKNSIKKGSFIYLY